jgi:hypothetical protein
MADYTTKFKRYKLNSEGEFQENFVESQEFKSNDQIYQSKTDSRFIIPYPKGKKGNIFPFRFLRYHRSVDDTEDSLNFFIRRFYKFENDPNRIYVIMYCNDMKTGKFERFEYYTSISDGSYWRFCIKSDGEERLDKGYNYISSTFINIQIQKFIFECMNEFEISLKTTSTIDCQLTSSLNSILRERIIDSTHVSTNEVFVLINELFPTVDYLRDFKVCLGRLLAILSDLTIINRESDINKIDILSNIYCSLSSNGLNKDIKLIDEPSKRNFFTNIGLAFLKVFQNYFIINENTKKALMLRSFNVGQQQFLSAMCCVEIEYIVMRGRRYLLYYMIYSSATIESSKTILHIIPKENDINVYGLDDRYVAAGALINKIFDYTSQAPGLEGPKESGYTFIGDLVNYKFLPDFSEHEFGELEIY